MSSGKVTLRRRAGSNYLTNSLSSDFSSGMCSAQIICNRLILGHAFFKPIS